jgi:hypothetical protein
LLITYALYSVVKVRGSRKSASAIFVAPKDNAW